MKISIIAPTIRPEGLAIVRASLKKQTFKDFEWLIGSPFNPEIPEAKWVKDDFKGGFWTLNRIYNKLIKEAQGELIVSLQDNIYIPPDGLEKFWIAHEKYPNAILATSGDQYESVDKFGRVQIKIWQDPRRRLDQGSFYEIFPQDCEWNYCAVPKKALYKIGGFCEKLDGTGYGMDGYQVNERLDLEGFKFFIDHSNESFTIRHNRDDFGGQENWDKNNNLNNGEYEKVRLEFIDKGEWPRMKYLTRDS